MDDANANDINTNHDVTTFVADEMVWNMKSWLSQESSTTFFKCYHF